MAQLPLERLRVRRQVREARADALVEAVGSSLIHNHASIHITDFDSLPRLATPDEIKGLKADLRKRFLEILP